MLASVFLYVHSLAITFAFRCFFPSLFISACVNVCTHLWLTLAYLSLVYYYGNSSKLCFLRSISQMVERCPALFTEDQVCSRVLLLIYLSFIIWCHCSVSFTHLYAVPGVYEFLSFFGWTLRKIFINHFFELIYIYNASVQDGSWCFKNHTKWIQW